jgi:alanine racemase
MPLISLVLVGLCMRTRVTATIDLKALVHNYHCVKAYAPNSKVMTMIKGNAYGHGMLAVAHALHEADILAVERPSQALFLKQKGVKQDIIVMGGFQDAEELKQMAAEDILSVIHTKPQVDILEQTPLSKPLKIWLKIDTGMHRLGVSPKDFADIYARLQNLKDVVQPIGCMTHFACADEPDNPATTAQINLYNQLIPKDVPQSLANSAAILTKPETHRDYVRPGIMLYGASPFADSTGEAFGLKPVMTLKACLLAINERKKGDSIGYGATWQCPHDTRIGTLSIGYADGYPRHAKNGTPVLLNGVICPVVGRVSMDFVTIDLKNCPQAKIDDMVTLWGDGLPVEKVAQSSGTISYELLTKVTSRVEVIL